MVFLLRLPTGQTNYKLDRLRHGNSKQFKGPFKVLAAQRQELIKEGQENGRYNKRLNQVKLLNNNLKNCRDSIELFQLMQKNQKIMDAINVSTSAVAASRLASSKNSNDIEIKNILSTYTLLCQLILQYADKMNSQSVANCLWSLGKAIDRFGLKKKPDYEYVFKKLCERANIISNEMKPQATSNSLWAMAKFQWDDVTLIRKIIKQSVNKSKEKFKPQDVSNNLWAMATLKYYDEDAIQHFVELSKTCLQEMKGQEVSNLMWALQQLRYYNKELILQIEDTIINKKNIAFDSQVTCNIMLAFTDFGLQNKQQIFEILVPNFLSSRLFNRQDWSNFLYSLALLGCPLNLSQKVVDKLLVQQNQKKIILQDIQLRQVQLAQVFYTVRELKLYFPPDLEQKCKKELQDYMREKMLMQNSFFDSVFTILKSHFEFAQKKILVYEDQIQVQNAIQLGEKTKVAVMPNPTQSYFVNCPEKLSGRCQHHRFLLEQLGWQVVEVSAFKWSNSQQYQQKIIDDVQAKFI